MTPPTNEKRLVTAIVTAIRRQWPDAWVFKTVGNPYQISGIPDLLVVVGGRMTALEVKHQRPGESKSHARGRATPQQRHQILALRKAGAVAEVVVSVEGALAAVRSSLRDW